MFPADRDDDDSVEMNQQGQFGGGGGMNLPNNFAPRLSLGGANFFAGGMDRRPSLGAPSNAGALPIDAAVSELLGRRTSLGSGYDGGAGNAPEMSRRDSLEATASVLDACILDLTRRRRASAGMGPPAGLPPSPNGFPSPNDAMSFGQRSANSGLQTALAARQQQLQMQQQELENRQQELEMQRQQLLAGLQDSSIHQRLSGIPWEQPPSMGPPSMVPPMASSYLQQMNDTSLPLPHEEEVMEAMENQQAQQVAADQPQSQQWWVCQICNSKAFASRSEATEHEAICDFGRHETLSAPPRRAREIMPVDPETLALIPQPICLAMPTDKDWLTALHCFVREHCVEVFTACPDDVAHPAKGKRKPIQVGQVGIRCPFCHIPGDPNNRERGSVYYPTTISSIYNATMNLLQRHLHSCPSVPDDIMEQYQTLKADDARSGTSKKYWVESALSLGLVDTPAGIRYSNQAPPPLPQLSFQQHATKTGKPRHADDLFSTKSHTAPDSPPKDGEEEAADADEDGAEPSKLQEALANLPEHLVEPEDKPYATSFSYELMRQMKACCFTEADRLGKRKGLPPGYAGLACRHCFGGYGSGRFFPSSIKTLSDTSKTLNVLHNHMLKCRKCPQEVTKNLLKLRSHHDEERSKMKFGSQKAFFNRIWARLHGPDDDGDHRTSIGMKRRNSQVIPRHNNYPQQEPIFSGGFATMGGVMGLGGLDVLSRQAASAAQDEQYEQQSKRHRSV